MNVTVTQILRPIKLAILIRPNKTDSYVKAIQICSSLWGGKHFPILPVYKKFSIEYRKSYHLITEKPIEFYRNALDNFDPDFLVVDDELDERIINAIKKNREVVNLKAIEDSILKGQSEYGIAIDELLQTIKENEFKHERTDSLRACCPRFRKRDLLAMTLCGNIHPYMFEKIRNSKFPKKYISYPLINQSNLNQCLAENILNYLSITTYKTDVFGSPLWSSGFAVYFINMHSLDDLINIWTYRALGWNIVPIPIGMIEDSYYKNQVEIQQKEFCAHTRLTERINVFFNHEVNRESMDECLMKLNNIQASSEKRVEYILHWWLPRFWEKGEFLSYDRAAAVFVKSKSKQTLLSIEDLKIHVPVLSPIFEKRYVRHIKPRYVNEISLEFDEGEGKFAQVLPDMPTTELDFIIRGSGSNQWIFSEGVMIFLAHENDQYLSLVVPKAFEVFKKWFAVRQIEIGHSAPGKLANQLLKNIGGIYGINFLASPGIPPILSLFENGKTVLKKTLDAELSRQLSHFRDKDIFYTPSHNPNEIKWAYRGMWPFSRNNKAEGLLCVLLTLRFFKITMHLSLITPLLNFELLKNNQVINEVDLGIFFTKNRRSGDTPDLFLCECKTEIDFADKDVDKMKKLGQLFPGSVLTFATLKLELSVNEKERIKKLVNYFRKGLKRRPINPVLILTSNELLPKNVFAAFANIQHRFIGHLQFSDEIGHLADVSCQHYLDLPSFASLVEERIDAKLKAHQQKKESVEEQEN